MRKQTEEEQKLVKNLECIECKKMITCKGKPREVKRCLNFEQRRKQ